MSWVDRNYRVKVTVDKTKVAAILTDYNAVLKTSILPAHFHSNVLANYGDVIITASDGVTRWAAVMDAYNTGGQEGLIGIGIPSLPTATDLEFYVNYGKAGATQPARDAAYGEELVFNSNIVLRLNLEELPSGAPPQMIDSTSNNNDGTSQGSMTPGDRVSGSLEDYCLDFDGVDDSAHVADDATLESNEVMIEFLMTPTSTISAGSPPASDEFVLSKNAAGNNAGDWYITFDSVTDAGKLLFVVQNGVGSHLIKSDVATWTAGTWYHVVCTVDASRGIRMYVNGTLQTDTEVGDVAIQPVGGNSAPFVLAGHSSTGFEFAGKLNEVLQYNDYNVDWISTRYENLQNHGTFYKSVGAPETNPAYLTLVEVISVF